MADTVVVVGGGAAGLMAAVQAAKAGAAVILLEKNDRLGKKILITGKGRCNLTNDTDVPGLIAGMPGNGRFLYSAFCRFGSQDLIAWVTERGLAVKTERGKRVFPQSDQAEEVVSVFAAALREAGVEVRYHRAVSRLLTENGAISGVQTAAGEVIPARAVILATGGSSYPGTGSTGDGYRLAQALGHRIVPLRPSLIPLVTEEDWVPELQGLTLKNVAVSATAADGRSLGVEFGELLFTHYGVSGPTVLSLSRSLIDHLGPDRPVTLHLNLKPALSPEQLDERLQRDFTAYQRKQFKNALGDLFPRLLIPVMVRLSGIGSDVFVHQITREERQRLVGRISDLLVTVRGTRPLAEAVVTAGGVATQEVNPKTMESKLVPGLYLAGEVLDVDGYTGGFNLQTAFSTGYAAGQAAAGRS